MGSFVSGRGRTSRRLLGPGLGAGVILGRLWAGSAHAAFPGAGLEAEALAPDPVVHARSEEVAEDRLAETARVLDRGRRNVLPTAGDQ